MLGTIVRMQTRVVPYSITVVPLYEAGPTRYIVVPKEQYKFVCEHLACGDTVNYEEKTKNLYNVPTGKEHGYDRMLVEDIEDGVDIDNAKHLKFHLFGKCFGYQIVKTYANPYKIRIGDEVLVEQNPDNLKCVIRRNLSLEERRKMFLSNSH